MTVQETRPASQRVPVIPDGAPFSAEQRSWLNGFFAGLLSLEAEARALPLTGGLPDAAAKAIGAEEDDGAPWHDAAMPIAERMQLAEGRPLKRQLYAAMAQQDCGQCGYLCETYSAAIAAGTESKLNLCAPGGKETSRMLKKLLEEAPASAAAAPATAVAAETPAADTPSGAAGYCREKPVEAVFLGARRITAEASDKDTRHVAFDIAGSGIDYAPGDSFGLFAQNDPALVDAVLAAMRAPAEFPVGGKSLRQALIEDYALGTAPDMLFELMSYITGGERRRKARLLAKGEDPDGDAATMDVLQTLERFAPVHPDPEAFLECLEPLQPRLYSISSSPLATPGELHLTVDPVRYDIAGRRRLGVASTFLADRLTPGTRLKVYLQKAHGFGLPADAATPIIMVGPGTGIAPFRSFLWHRCAAKAPGKAWLFFGHQHEATDFFYRDEIEGFLGNGTLTRLSTAWSRDGAEKVYVQDRMREAGAELWRWLGEGAHLYVCGDAKRMAKDVETAVVAIAVAHGAKSEAQAAQLVADLKAQGRYQADVY
ncbi:MAG: sulfite reductase subunit alpha [Hyphomicrobiaceae bacterium]|nr:sulfite reductase subunit alpha [Hyphomicrobiaceae bacterium]